MLQETWLKSIPLTFQLHGQDAACEVTPLPLLVDAKLNHYIGFYHQVIQEFFFRYALQPNTREEFWLEYTSKEGKTVELKPTELVVNLYMRYFRHLDESPLITVHYRREIGVPMVDLLYFYRQNVKASTTIKHRRQAAAPFFNLSPVEQTMLGECFKSSNFSQFYGSPLGEDQEERGFRLLSKCYDKIPVRIYTKQERLERALEPNSTLGELLNNLNLDPSQQFYLWAVPVPNLVAVRQLVQLCHPDGFLYLYMDI